MKRKRKQGMAPANGPAADRSATRNPQLPIQTRKAMRTHYAAKYRTR